VDEKSMGRFEFKHDNRLKCHRGIVSQWTFQVGLNVTVDETWVDVTSRHQQKAGPRSCCCRHANRAGHDPAVVSDMAQAGL
jgi:hypothetical protein